MIFQTKLDEWKNEILRNKMMEKFLILTNFGEYGFIEEIDTYAIPIEIKIRGILNIKKLYLTYSRATPPEMILDSTGGTTFIFGDPSLIIVLCTTSKSVTFSSIESLITYIYNLTEQIPYTLEEDIFKPPIYSTNC
jgi:hypothetical protein